MSMIPFDDRDGFIWYDGRLVPWRDAKLHVLSHGLHYASCVFEGERVYDGTVFRLDDHNERLLNSAQILGFEVPASMDDLTKATQEVIVCNRIVDGYVRPVAWRGAEQMGVSAQATKIHLAIAAWDWPAYFSPEARAKGIRMKWAPWARPAPHTAPTAGQGGRALHDLHDVKARGRGRGLRRRADARLARPARRGHRRQHLPRHQWRAAHPDTGLLSERHHPPDRDRPRQKARDQGDRAARSCPTSSPRPTKCS